MNRKAVRFLVLLAVVGAVAVGVLFGPQLKRRFYQHGLRVVPVATGLEAPWGLAFLPDGSMLVTERPGRMRRILADGRLGPPLGGLPAVYVAGEGGLLDVAVSPDFARSHRIYWAYSEPGKDGGAGTAIARARLEGQSLEDVEVIFRQPATGPSNAHFGARFLFGRDGNLWIGLGDRRRQDDAQRLDSLHGKLIRMTPDGGVPPDNPFVGQAGAQPLIWSLGHRNIQGLAVHPGTGSLWASEHGPWGGDEVNLIRPGANYGWPVITYGCEYGSCAKIGEGTAKPGLEQPLTWFGPDSVPPTGLAFVSSDRYPQWKGQLFMSTLSGQALVRMQVDGDRVVGRESMWLGAYKRTRSVTQGPDGWLYLTADFPQGTVLRLEQ